MPKTIPRSSFGGGLGRLLLSGVFVGCGLLTSCSRPELPTGTTDVSVNNSEPVYAQQSDRPSSEIPETFAVVPRYSPARLREDFQPMANWITRKIGGRSLRIEPSVSFASFEAKIREAWPEWLIANPWQSLLAIKHGYTVIAMTGEPKDFRGVFLARRDRGIAPEGDWRGLTFAYPSPTALAACLLPQWHLHQRGINVNTEVSSTYVGTQESAILSALERVTDVGVTWTVPWEHFQRDKPELAAQLTVLAVTEAFFTNNVVLARKNVAPERIAVMRTTLLQMHEAEDAQPLFGAVGFTHFRPATDHDYAAVQTFIERFETEVRRVETAQ